MKIIAIFVLASVACVLSGPVPFPYSPLSYYQPNPFLDKGPYNQHPPIYQPSQAHGVYYQQAQYPHHPQPQQEPHHPFVYPYEQQPRPGYQVPQQYPYMNYPPYHGQTQNLNPQVNQIIPGGDRLQDFTQFNFHQENPAAINGILSQFVNRLRDPSQQGPTGYPHPQQSFSNVQISSASASGGNNGNDLVKQVTAIVYNPESGDIKEVPTFVFPGSADGTQLGVVTLVAEPTPQLQVPANTDAAPVQTQNNYGETGQTGPISQADETLSVSENVAPVQESTNENGEMSDSNPQDDVIQAEINKKYPVTILKPDLPDSGISTTGNTDNGSTSEKVNSSETEFNTETPETSTVIPSGASSDNEQSVGDKISGTITSTTGPPPEWDVLSENLNKAPEGDTTVAAIELEPPSPK